MGVKDTSSGGPARVRDTTDIHPGYVVLASSTLPDVRQPRLRPYVVLFRKQKYFISLPFTSSTLRASLGDARRSHEREPDTYYPIAPSENGGIYDPIKVVLGSFSGCIDLLCPTTLGKHTIEWGRNMDMISSEDLTKVIDAHKRLVWGMVNVPHELTVAPPLADTSSGTPLQSQSESGPACGTNSDRRSLRRRRLPARVGPRNRDGLDGGCNREGGGGGNKGSRPRTAQAQREASPQNSSGRYKRKRQNSGPYSLKRTRHLSPDPRDTVQGTEGHAGGGRLDCYMKSVEEDWYDIGALEDISTLSPASAKSWVWSGTSSEPEETSGETGQEDRVTPNMSARPEPLPRALPSGRRAFPPTVANQHVVHHYPSAPDPRSTPPSQQPLMPPPQEPAISY